MIRRFAVASMLGVVVAALGPGSVAEASTPPVCVLSVQETGGKLLVVSPTDRIVAEIPIGERPHEIAVSDSGRTAYVSQFGISDYDGRIGTPGDRVAEIDLLHARRVADFVLPSPDRGPHGVKLRPGSRELFVNSEVGSHRMFVFDTRTRRVVRSFLLPNGTHNFIFATDGRSLYSFAGANGVDLINPDSGKVQAHLSHDTPIRGLFLTRSGTILASARGELIELRASDLGILRRYPAPRPGQYIYAEQWPDGTIIAPSPADGGVALFSAEHDATQFTLTGKSPILVRRGPDDLAYVSNAEDDHITVLDRQGHVLRTIPGLVGPNGLGFGQCPAATAPPR